MLREVHDQFQAIFLQLSVIQVTSNCISIFNGFSFCRIMEELLCLELFCEMQIVTMYMVYAVCFLEVVHLTVTVLFDI